MARYGIQRMGAIMWILTMFGGFGGVACDRPTHAAADLPAPAQDLSAAPATTQPAQQQTAVFAGGCFWCSEAVFEQLDGVSSVISGYAGGTAESAQYETVSAGGTGHAESIQITYDPSKITYGQLLRVFFTTHDPTTKDRQGPDWGHQYRSAIFYANEDQKRVAEAYIRQLDQAKVFDQPIVTTVEPLDKFYPAEDYHQDYVRQHPDNPYVRQWAFPKIDKVRSKFPAEVKSPTTRPAGAE